MNADMPDRVIDDQEDLDKESDCLFYQNKT